VIDLQFDMRSLERRAQEIGGALDQLPFVIMKSLNEAADKTRDHLINQTWPSSVQVRDPRFMDAALTTRGERARKDTLRVTIYNKSGRGQLGLHDTGGVKMAKGRLAIPTANIKAKRGAGGVPKGMRPMNLPNTFIKGDVIYQRVGKYWKKGKRKSMSAFAGRDQRHLVPVYKLAPNARLRADVPFTIDFRHVMTREVHAAFSTWMATAMRTRR
jgi:hypothetical protein